MKYITGNLLDSKAEALINTVNTKGVMGKGIALQFKEKFPLNYKVYVKACKEGTIAIGKLLEVMEDGKLIINFPTKIEWYRKSQYNYIEEGLKDLLRIIKQCNIRSIAIPPLGCGNGGLEWSKVKVLIEKYLGSLEGVEIEVYQPADRIKEIIRGANTNKPIQLTPARAMLLYALFKYERLGESASLFAANKIAYFLQRMGEDMRLQFVPHYYGPYANAVEKVLYQLNGKYLDGLEQMNAKAFEPLSLNWSRYDELENYVKLNLSDQQKIRLDKLFLLLEGFESNLSLEILASVQFLLDKEPDLNEIELLKKIQSWNNRKKSLIKKEYVVIALDHLRNSESMLTPVKD
jgi:O-acetyl-ADP-ribose deacetylase (regulator of RNase III)